MELAWTFFEIMLINLVLSGDNAVIIALASKNLNARQRKQAVIWGALGAVFLRLILTAIAVIVLQIPLIEALGACMLLYIAIKLTSNDQEAQLRPSSTLLAAVWTIIVADFIMSMDNVLAIAAIADGHMAVLCAGIIFSIPIIVWGSSFMIMLMDRLPILNSIGAAILGFTAGEMLIRDQMVHHWLKTAHPSYHIFVPVLAVFLVLVGGRLIKREA